LRARSEPRTFSQTNDGVASALRDSIVQLIPAGQDLLIDAFCGAGFFAKALRDKFERVVGIDWDRFAIAAAKETATAKENYIAGDVETGLRSAFEQSDAGKTVLIVDPPATGLTVRMCETIIDLAPATFIYVSCNPSTLARDLKDFSKRFKLESVTPLDMFPQTAEIEVVAHLKRLNDSTI
jgi:23S rRNA (uracil1939-C5)-methyltransferase